LKSAGLLLKKSLNYKYRISPFFHFFSAAAGVRSNLRRCLVFNQQRTKQKIYTSAYQKLTKFIYMNIVKISIAILTLFLTSSCKDKKTHQDIISQKIELAVRSSSFFKDSELSEFKKYEIISIKLEELPNYKRKLSDIETYSSLLEEAVRLKRGDKVENKRVGDFSKEELDSYISMVENDIANSKYRLLIIEKMRTDTMYKVICKERMQIGLLTSAHIYLNDKFEVVDFLH
jgi:hypothetical protein